MKCLNKVIIIIITSTKLTTSWYFIAPVRAVHFAIAVSHSHDALAVTALELFLLAFCKEHHGKFTWRDTLLVISIEVVLNDKSNPILYYIEPDYLVALNSSVEQILIIQSNAKGLHYTKQY